MLLDKGIFFEDNRNLLKWGFPIGLITIKNKPETLKQEDRVIFKWGKHTILGGLEVDLSTTYWRTFKIGFFKKFNHVESWFIGDKIAFTEFDKISKHLEQKFGKPSSIKNNAEEKEIKYSLEGVEILLYLFEQHCFKLVFRISKL
jgi:hypothetical protein